MNLETIQWTREKHDRSLVPDSSIFVWGSMIVRTSFQINRHRDRTAMDRSTSHFPNGMCIVRRAPVTRASTPHPARTNRRDRLLDRCTRHRPVRGPIANQSHRRGRAPPWNSCTTCIATETLHASGDRLGTSVHTPHRPFERKSPYMRDNQTASAPATCHAPQIPWRFRRKVKHGRLAGRWSRDIERSVSPRHATISRVQPAV